MSAWPIVALEDVFEVARGGSPRPIDSFITDDPNGVNWIMIGDASEGSKYISSTKKRIIKEGVKKSRLVSVGDFLLTNSMSFGKPYILKTSGCIHDGWLVLSPRHDQIHSDFFYHLLGSDVVYSKFKKLAAGAVVKNLNSELVRGVPIPLPPLDEQKRIAAILDKADSIRRKLQQSLRLSDDFLRSVFLDMFGDPVTNPKGWPVHTLTSVIGDSFRNGLSPSTSGTVAGKVLTLSAVTSGTFAPQFLRDAIFDRTPSENQQVTRNTFLVCRGNGNKSMVGIGVFPEADMPSVSFPDTMIACTIDRRQIEPQYLQAIWLTAKVRKQIDAGARTTNGTYKVNQTLLGSIEFPMPPLELQRIFSAITRAIRSQSAKTRKLAAESEILFSSLQQRAFRGEL